MSGYRYVECGLDNVVIEDAGFLTDDAGGACVNIPNIAGLHKAIAFGIVQRESGMTGKELRFLRSEMGWTQSELASFVHREPLAISRWERGEGTIDSNAEALIRLLAVQKLELPADNVAVDELAGWCIPSAQRMPIVIDGTNPDDYQLKPAA